MNRTISFIILIMATIFSSCKAGNVDLGIELNEGGDRYRVRIKNSGTVPTTFSQVAFVVPVDGGAPMGSRIIVRDRNDRPIYLGAGEDRGYSSNDMVSQVFPARKPEWRSIAAGETYFSSWFSLRELMQGLEIAAEEPDRKKWKDFKLLFFVDIKGETSVRIVSSEWFPFRTAK